MVDPAAEFTLEHLRHWWTAIAPVCTADLDVSVDLWALLQRSWSLSSIAHKLPTVLGQTYETELATSALAPHIRKRQGSYYTPAAIAQFMVEATLGAACRDCATAPTVLDPACGGGVFLVTAYRYLAQYYRPSCPDDGMPLLAGLFGVDVDPNAVAVTRLALGLAMIEAVLRSDLAGRSSSGETLEELRDINFASLSQTIRCGNTLVRSSDPPNAIAPSDHLAPYPLPQTQFDVVLGNPPYLDSEAMTRHLPHWRTYCRAQYQTARGNWDLFCVFIERALDLCRDGGWHSFVVPNKLTSAAYAAEARSLLGCYHLHYLRDYSRVNAFQAAVYPIVYVVQKSASGPSSPFRYEVMHSLDQPAAIHRRCSSPSSPHPWCFSGGDRPLGPVSGPGDWVAQLQTYPTLGDALAVVGAASVSEAYRLQPLIHEQPHPKNALRLVNSGTIDRYVHHWGHKPLQYLGDRYRHPVIAKPALVELLPKRYRQATASKLIVAGLTRQLECVWDKDGTVMAGKSTTLILLPPGSADALGPILLGLLNSALLTAYFQAMFGGNALQGGYLRVGPPQVRLLPLPCRGLKGLGLRGDRLCQLVRQRQALNRHAGAAGLREMDGAIDRAVDGLYGVSWRDVDGP
ncbi:MAG: N-6 DNA methylase [Elainellaceae cyanobacterium]